MLTSYHDFMFKREFVICVVAVYVYVLTITLIRQHASDSKSSKKQPIYMFLYCDGSRQKVVAREIVTYDMFARYDELVGYPVLHIADSRIYFNIC